MSKSDTVDVFELRYTKADMAAAPEADRDARSLDSVAHVDLP